MQTDAVPIIIPCFEPDERFVKLVEDLCAKVSPSSIVVVDDGSGPAHATAFDEVAARGVYVIRHAVNLGKGRALKDAFNHVLLAFPDAPGCVTADSDGQHTPTDILRVADALCSGPDKLVLGVRVFDKQTVPAKSRIGNLVTRRLFSLFCGVNVSDTQTGLRGVPNELMAACLSLPGERFEFEMEMLAHCRNRFGIVEVPIETVYDSVDDHSTHFDPLRDSVRIGKVLLRTFVGYSLSSLMSSVVDLGAFALLSEAFKVAGIPFWAGLAVIVARVFSATFNFLVNWKGVFKAEGDGGRFAVRYFALAIVQMLVSAFLVDALVQALPLPAIVTKAIVDVLLFFVSYQIQSRFVFKADDK